MGLRLYFDSTTRPAKLGTVTSVAVHFSPMVIEPNNGFFGVSLKLPALPQFKSDAPAYLFQQQNTTTTIDYAYDPLYRLTSADYSTGDFYHYTYDEVGNRLSQQSMVNGSSSSVNYTYDNANRLSTVDGVNYTFDDNGNLLNDGQNTYTYDSANRLISVSDQSTMSSYRYNGLGDKLSQNGDNYTLDLNAGLTQVLDDGTSTYAYGLGRISQTNNSTAEYFLGDALGSVRQLTADNGDITLTKSYDPYGNVIQSAGSGSSAFAFTGEQADSHGLVFLRARYYSSDTGRFTSRDTWGGDANSPMSFNQWNYVQSNPINHQDPTGNFRIPCNPLFTEGAVKSRVDEAEKYVSSTSDPMDTYTAAGIAIQCAGWDGFTANSGKGAAQISDNQADTAYGVLIGKRDNNRGHGLKCFIPIGAQDDGSCALCKTPEEIAKMSEKDRKDFETNYVLEGAHDQTDKRWAAIYMRRRIDVVVNDCKKCSATDKYIIAALAQNGPGFTRLNMEYLPGKDYRSEHDDVTIDWKKYFDKPNNSDDTNVQLDRFQLVIDELKRRRWIVPYINTEYINTLRKIGD